MSQRTTNYPSLNGTEPVRLASTEVKPKRGRRRFTTEYKLAILAEADRSQESGDIGALLRREGGAPWALLVEPDELATATGCWRTGARSGQAARTQGQPGSG